jgi:hypothetical protein
MRGLFAPPPGVDRRKRAHRSGAITFCLVGLTISIFTVYSILGPTSLSSIEQHGIPNSLQRRSLNDPQIQDLEVRVDTSTTILKANRRRSAGSYTTQKTNAPS